MNGAGPKIDALLTPFSPDLVSGVGENPGNTEPGPGPMTRGTENDTGYVRGKVRLLTLRKASELELAGAMFTDQISV